MTEVFDLMKWLIIIPLCGLVMAITGSFVITFAEVVFTILTRLKWRLIDYLDRNFSRSD